METQKQEFTDGDVIEAKLIDSLRFDVTDTVIKNSET